MKTFTKLNLGVAALLTAGAISPLSVFADDVAEGTTSLQGNTTITFEAPKTGLLTLNDNTIKAGQYKGTIDYTLSPSMD
ncbi:hypothetical protein FFRU_060600 [Fructobacillus fructosus]|uniref:hypothetical protein n=1 Tax=Fructobacillus fructosus TaxID=1631 RepID=UPI00021955FB|nr:hypothetical protein [Fructobacillus fructosus]KRN52666.1 hypothetical protein IV71_GL001060 [Fructobacillus fructosus KCTC 3544]GAP01335.1 hypothetical protein FFRU_060600 [Fructobacillus fructosus]